jgi:hypothetical protein
VKKFVVSALTVVVCVAACGGSTTTPRPSSTLGPSATASGAAEPTTGQPSPVVTDSPTDTAASPRATTVPTPGATPPPASESPTVSGWRQVDEVGPTGREDHTWTVDDAGTTAYLFGGRTADGPSNELWAFDLVTDTWTALQPGGDAPARRFGHTGTWVPDTGLVVWSGQGQGADFFDDIWAYDPAVNAWRQLPSLGAVPAARYGSCASIGPDGELWISHGFTFEGRFSDTRSYNFEDGTWTDRTPLGEVPVERCLHDCYWSSNGKLVLYGGQTNGVAALGDVWSYDYEFGDWTRGPESDAPARQLYSLAVVPIGAVVFGGGALDGGYLADTWSIGSLTPGDLAMTQFQVPGLAPPARSGATLIDAGRRALLFGGRNADGVLDDLWELSV